MIGTFDVVVFAARATAMLPTTIAATLRPASDEFWQPLLSAVSPTGLDYNFVTWIAGFAESLA
jgi:ABC-type sugar transport system substrate-binding protein